MQKHHSLELEQTHLAARLRQQQIQVSLSINVFSVVVKNNYIILYSLFFGDYILYLILKIRLLT
jgi:hypothetical protein